MDEPSALVRYTMYFIGSGDSAIVGAAGIAFLVIRAAGRHRTHRLFAVMILTIGPFLILCGSPALPAWYFAFSSLWCSYLIAWRVRERASRAIDATDVAAPSASPLTQGDQRRCSFFDRRAVLITTIIWFTTGLVLELPYHVLWPIRSAEPRLLIIGDSVTAGLIDGEETWPMLVARDLKVDVLDASQPGATLDSALLQNAHLADATGLTILEIGGNDLLEGLPVEQFTRSLEHLLSKVHAPGRQMVMFELPLTPLCSRYGAAQRRLARKHQLQLIPKRCFLRLLTMKGSTVDGIHLSEIGQSRMARFIESSLKLDSLATTGTYRRVDR